MSSDKKKGKGSVESLVDETDKETLKIITEGIEEYLRSGQVGETDPFEIYVKRIHAKFHKSPEQFADRFEKGYSVLLKELSQ